MKRIATVLPLIFLCVFASSCSRSVPNLLVGTWKSDLDLTVASVRRDRGQLRWTPTDVIQSTESHATFTFTNDSAKIDSPNSGIVQSEFNYSVVSVDATSVTISLLAGANRGIKTDSFHFEGPDVMWTQNENQIQLLPITNFRQYYRRLR